MASQGGWEVLAAVPEVRQAAREDCGAAALAMVLNDWGRPVTLDEIALAGPPEGINRQKQRVLTLDPAHGLRVSARDAFAVEWAKAGQLTLVIFPQVAALKVVANPDK